MKKRTAAKRKALQAPRWSQVLCDSAMRGGAAPPACALIARESQARLAAEAANCAKDDFFLTLSHELRGLPREAQRLQT
jgi:hypothetical protein